MGRSIDDIQAEIRWVRHAIRHERIYWKGTRGPNRQKIARLRRDLVKLHGELMDAVKPQ